MSDIDKRVRYYNGQFLKEQDFTAEQSYHLDRQRRHNRLLHSPGIAEGLTVAAEVGASSVVVSKGTAIDGEGRMIVLTESTTLQAGSRTGAVLVVISYAEELSDPATVGDEGDTRSWEQPKVEFMTEAEAETKPAGVYIRLARLQLAGGAVSQHDATVRNSAGRLSAGSLKIENPLGSTPQFIRDQNGNQSSLAVGTEKVEISTKNQGIGFSIAGEAALGPIVELKNAGNSASIHYANKSKEGVWHAGVGPENNFFFWNKESNVSALFTPHGVLQANGLKLSGQGVAAEVTGDLSVTGRALVAGRDISADGTKLDKSLAIEALGEAPKPVQDQKGTASPLAIGTKNVTISAETGNVVLNVVGNVNDSPLLELKSSENEASIRYMTKSTKGKWHVGAGGLLAGEENFFFWNQTEGVVAKITPEGKLSSRAIETKNVAIDADPNKIALNVTGSVINAPLMELVSKENESSIRYVTKSGSWHVGTGGAAAGAENFFFWNKGNIIAKLAPDGELSVNGKVNGRDIRNDGARLDELGRSYLQRAFRKASFTDAHAQNHTVHIDAGFRPKLIMMEGRAMGTLKTRPYGGAVGGLCHIDDQGAKAAGHGPHVILFSFQPYMNFYNEMTTFDDQLAAMSFHDDEHHVFIALLVGAITSTGFELKLFRRTDPPRTAPAFQIDVALSLVG